MRSAESHHTTRRVTRLVRTTKLSPVRWVTKYEYPYCNNFFFFFSFSPIPFQGDIKPAELQHCVMSLLLRVFIINLLVISPCPYLPEFIYNIIAETLTSNTHLGILGFVASPRQYSNKSKSSNYTVNSDLAKSKAP